MACQRRVGNIAEVFDQATSNSDVMMLAWLEQNCGIMLRDHGPALFGRAADDGNIDLMRWLFKHGCSGGDELDSRLYHLDRTWSLNIVKWLIRHEIVDADYILENAASNGALNVAKFVYDRYWEAICEDTDLPDVISADTMRSAILRGGAATVKWLFQTCYDDPDIDLFWDMTFLDDEAIDLAARAGILPLVKYLHAITTHFDGSSGGSKKRKRGETMRGIGPTCSAHAMENAAAMGHLAVVEWLHHNREEGCSPDAMDLAACSGHLKMVQWLHFNRDGGCTVDAMDDAARCGHLDIVKWLHENRSEGCTTDAMDQAARQGHLTIVQWLHAHRKEGCTTSAMNEAATNGHLEVVKWLHFNRTEGCTTRAMDGAAEKGKLQVLRWMHRNRSEGCTTKAMDEAAGNGHYEVVSWLQNHRQEGCTSAALDSAALYHDLDLLLRLHSYSDQGCTHRARDYNRSERENGCDNVYKWLLRHYPDLEEHQ